MELLSSSYPYSMVSLIDSKNRSLQNFFSDKIIPLSFYGLGSVESLLNLKRHELEMLEKCMQDEELQTMYHNLHCLGL